jgi:hypothetical protein
MGWDEGSPIMRTRPGAWLEFSEAAFAEHYQAQAQPSSASPQASASIAALAAAYSTGAADVFIAQPELWALVTSAAVQAGTLGINAGPAPVVMEEGFAMASAKQLGMTDLYLADPQIAALNEQR